jgi:hypothetical protein
LCLAVARFGLNGKTIEPYKFVYSRAVKNWAMGGPQLAVSRQFKARPSGLLSQRGDSAHNPLMNVIDFSPTTIVRLQFGS